MSERPQTAFAHLKVRMKEPLRAALEGAAKERGVSMNAEVVRRIEQSFRQDQQFGDPELSRLAFTLAAYFAIATQGEDWRSDPIVYAKGATAVFAELIRSVPSGPERRLAINGIVSHLLTQLAQAQEQDK
jgi:Arc-like DNA binding domain